MAETKKERQGIALAIYPDWKGARLERGIGIEGTVVIDEEDSKGALVDFDEVVESISANVAEGTFVDSNALKRSIKVKQNYRFDANLPVPTTDEDSMNLYGVSLASLVEAGVMKLSYDRDTNIGNDITEAIIKGEDFGTIPDVSKFEKSFEDELSTPKEKAVSQAKENKKKASELDALMEKFGVASPAELAALIAESKE